MADRGVGWREAGHASPRQAAYALVDATEHGVDEGTHDRVIDIVAAVLGAYGGSWPQGQPARKSVKASASVTLEPGDNLIQLIHIGTDPPRARVWTHQGAGVFVGHGGSALTPPHPARPPSVPTTGETRVQRRDRLGGVIRE